MFRILLFCLGFIALERFCHMQTDGFTIAKIRSTLTYNPAWETAPPAPEITEILTQKFFYLASGGSCYAFESEDGRHVLKFFKQHHLYPLSWANGLPMPAHWRRKLSKRQKKRTRVFTSCKIAFDDLREESGLLYIHLNKSDQALPVVTIFDKLGIAQTIALDGMEFLLQKKAEMTYPHIDRLMHSADVKGAEKAIDQILELTAHIAKKGLHDLDPNVETNLGFCEDRAIKVDVGPLIRKKFPLNEKKRVLKTTQRLKAWLHGRYPELLDYLNRRLQEYDDQSACERQDGGAA